MSLSVSSKKNCIIGVLKMCNTFRNQVWDQTCKCPFLCALDNITDMASPTKLNNRGGKGSPYLNLYSF